MSKLEDINLDEEQAQELKKQLNKWRADVVNNEITPYTISVDNGGCIYMGKDCIGKIDKPADVGINLVTAIVKNKLRDV